MAHWKQRETLFAEYALEITISGHWQLRDGPDPERWHYRSQDRKEQFTVIRSDSVDDESERERLVHRQRRAVELGFGRVGEVIFSENEELEREDWVPCTFFQATGEEHSVCVAHLFGPEATWVLLYEAFRLPPQEAREKAEAILSRTRFAETGRRGSRRR